MKRFVTVCVIIGCLAIAGPLLADECLEGNCDNGVGTGFTEDNKIYVGEWKHGLPDGQGKLNISKDKVVEGRWEKGVLVEEKKSSPEAEKTEDKEK